MKQTAATAHHRVPTFDDGSPLSHRSTVPGVEPWYEPVALTARMVGERSVEADVARRVLDVLKNISPDDYVEKLILFFETSLSSYHDRWRYSDIATALWACGELIEPRVYLEIGVRRGRSMATLATVAPECHLIGFDYWKPNYAGMDNPGPDFVRDELRRVGHRGKVEFVSGNSHETVPRYLTDNPDLYFDLVTVDGDHSLEGAAADLSDVLPRLKIGGAVVFDDICHPKHPELFDVWRAITSNPLRFSTWEYGDLGYGVGIAVRKR